MNSNLLLKIGISATTSLALTETLNLDILWNALITLAVSIVTVLTVEGVAWLRAFIKSKTPKEKNNESEKNSEKEE